MAKYLVILLLCLSAGCSFLVPSDATMPPEAPQLSEPVISDPGSVACPRPAAKPEPASKPQPAAKPVRDDHLPDADDADDGEMGKVARVMLDRYGNLVPKQWGERVTGVITRMDTQDKVIALTFDACGATGLSAGFDQELIDFLVQEDIPATMFWSGQWIQANRKIAEELAENPLFRIENHGYRHRPLSVTGKSVYGIKGTANIREVVAEIWLNDQLIEALTGRAPVYYRSGTAYYDEVAVMIARDLGKEVINFNVLGDAGATYSKAQIEKSLLNAKPGSIILYHMNRPETEIAQALIETLPKLREQGFRFVRLEEYHGQLK